MIPPCAFTPRLISDNLRAQRDPRAKRNAEGLFGFHTNCEFPTAACAHACPFPREKRRNAPKDVTLWRSPSLKNDNSHKTTITVDVTGNKIDPDPAHPPHKPRPPRSPRSTETSARFLLNYLFNGGRERHLITKRQI